MGFLGLKRGSMVLTAHAHVAALEKEKRVSNRKPSKLIKPEVRVENSAHAKSLGSSKSTGGTKFILRP